VHLFRLLAEEASVRRKKVHSMNVQQSAELGKQIQRLQALMMAFATDERTPDQPAEYRELYAEVQIALELAKYPHPNPHKSLEAFWAYCKSQQMKSYASRRVYIEELNADILLDLKRVQVYKPGSRNWTRANNVLEDELAPVRAQWLKAKNFIVAPMPDYDNSIKEAVNSIESCLMLLLNEPNATLGKIIKRAELDEDIQRLISQAYGLTSNKAFVRHGGVATSSIGKHEAEFFLEFAAAAIVYISAKLKHSGESA
jgi:hypothetical protein